ncbi:Hypothetical predicted protein [Paramuricea clavata]|uniref:Uncharacterized protein n=1 Tax=Paramuricea clavata TaxID=317549 RepID=A0A7D9D636_PARCT|nr:Hypothetical predicted protein [Paramuricea clavata]
MIHAAASALGTKILSIYPPVNRLLDKTVSILHRTFDPNKDCSPRPPIVLMWSNVSRPRTGVTWLPNHFVPLLLMKPPEGVDMTESVEKTIQNDDPKTSTPTSKKKYDLKASLNLPWSPVRTENKPSSNSTKLSHPPTKLIDPDSLTSSIESYGSETNSTETGNLKTNKLETNGSEAETSGSGKDMSETNGSEAETNGWGKI